MRISGQVSNDIRKLINETRFARTPPYCCKRLIDFCNHFISLLLARKVSLFEQMRALAKDKSLTVSI